jgi:hypothetical protein
VTCHGGGGQDRAPCGLAFTWPRQDRRHRFIPDTIKVKDTAGWCRCTTAEDPQEWIRRTYAPAAMITQVNDSHPTGPGKRGCYITRSAPPTKVSRSPSPRPASRPELLTAPVHPCCRAEARGVPGPTAEWTIPGVTRRVVRLLDHHPGTARGRYAGCRPGFAGRCR